eukprot:1159845-Pelagomonas_calceolata.AAC.5
MEPTRRLVTHLWHCDVNGNGGALQAMCTVADHALNRSLSLKGHKPKAPVLCLVVFGFGHVHVHDVAKAHEVLAHVCFARLLRLKAS